MGEAASENSLTSSNLIRLMPILNKSKREILPAKADAIKAEAAEPAKKQAPTKEEEKPKEDTKSK